MKKNGVWLQLQFAWELNSKPINAFGPSKSWSPHLIIPRWKITFFACFYKMLKSFLILWKIPKRRLTPSHGVKLLENLQNHTGHPGVQGISGPGRNPRTPRDSKGFIGRVTPPWAPERCSKDDKKCPAAPLSSDVWKIAALSFKKRRQTTSTAEYCGM